MVKEPRAGRVKTRLGKEIGMTAAAWWFRHQTARLLRSVQDRRWQTILGVSPDRAAGSARFWPASIPRLTQGAGDLGRRMERLIETAPPGPVILMGADIPGVNRATIADAFRLLARHDLVFGPAADGGFWLVGANRLHLRPAGLFDDVRWSSEHALADTLDQCSIRSWALAETLRDVDRARDLAPGHFCATVNAERGSDFT